MYGIFITCWHQENGGTTQVEHYNSIEFPTLKEACIYLSENNEEIFNWYPVDSIEIKLIKPFE